MLLAPIGELGVVEMQVPSPPHRRPEIARRATPDVLPATHVGSSSPNEETVVPAARSRSSSEAATAAALAGSGVKE
jgi:hypothetical protein